MTAQRSGGVTSAPVTVTEVGAALVITIDRPAAKNALDVAVARAIADALDRLDATDRLRVGILTGAGGTFSAGMDLKAFARGETPFLDGRGLCGLTEAPPRKPLIAAVEEWALAGGFELVLACDLVVAAETARFGLPEVTRGLVAAAGGALRLPSRIPSAIATEILLTGESFSASRARELGLLNAMTPPGGALAAALELAGRIGCHAPLAVEASVRIARGLADPADDWCRQETISRAVLDSEDAAEGAAAFAERRAPVWRGR
ncbi:crotonase/enoyl-CoA hydratase family protein [Gordonia sp. PP30]|uniref:crotonase/enoyl-CoA hydratase family protein n=1 Tax=Gordonia sp. PP30 TaxID=2935861 RepID=UPI0020002EFB|nr:crotonase/enoyl-CoA hydratase family protein [Gordonia sp. PP30]UQE76185.1 crotonase/enoyl-CoA hydratase family protein [Gordonia sp. PP30]